jgi:hypothetical protein
MPGNRQIMVNHALMAHLSRRQVQPGRQTCRCQPIMATDFQMVEWGKMNSPAMARAMP